MGNLFVQTTAPEGEAANVASAQSSTTETHAQQTQQPQSNTAVIIDNDAITNPAAAAGTSALDLNSLAVQMQAVFTPNKEPAPARALPTRASTKGTNNEGGPAQPRLSRQQVQHLWRSINTHAGTVFDTQLTRTFSWILFRVHTNAHWLAPKGTRASLQVCLGQSAKSCEPKYHLTAKADQGEGICMPNCCGPAHGNQFNSLVVETPGTTHTCLRVHQHLACALACLLLHVRIA